MSDKSDKSEGTFKKPARKAPQCEGCESDSLMKWNKWIGEWECHSMLHWAEIIRTVSL